MVSSQSSKYSLISKFCYINPQLYTIPPKSYTFLLSLCFHHFITSKFPPDYFQHIQIMNIPEEPKWKPSFEVNISNLIQFKMFSSSEPPRCMPSYYSLGSLFPCFTGIFSNVYVTHLFVFYNKELEPNLTLLHFTVPSKIPFLWHTCHKYMQIK